MARREITVSTPMEQFSASEERQLRHLEVVINGSSSSSSPSETPQPFVQLAGVQAARRTLCLDQISGAVEWETEELARLQLSMSAGRWQEEEYLEPEAQDPVGETPLQLGEGPSSRVPGDDPQWNGRSRSLLCLPAPPADDSLRAQSHPSPDDPSAMDSAVAGEHPNPSEELAPAQTTSSSSSQGSSTSRRSYLAKAFWEPRLVEEYEAYKAAASEERRHEIWLGWTPKERRWVLLVCGPQSRFRLEQNRWKAELRDARFQPYAQRRHRGRDPRNDSDEDEET